MILVTRYNFLCPPSCLLLVDMRVAMQTSLKTCLGFVTGKKEPSLPGVRIAQLVK